MMSIQFCRLYNRGFYGYKAQIYSAACMVAVDPNKGNRADSKSVKHYVWNGRSFFI